MEYKVSIFCSTYNHADTIRQALEGFVSQKTDFSYNVFVFDDASTDGTSDIVREYEKKYPHIFDVYIPEENTYNSPNRGKLIDALFKKYVTGTYVAWCEGDDCWIDNNKLQLEADFLEAHDDCSMVVHDSVRFDCRDNNVYPMHVFGDKSRFLSPSEVILRKKGNVATASIMYRNKDLYMPPFFSECDVGDINRQFYSLTVGKIYYMSRIMSLYRANVPGSWTDSMNDAEKRVRHALLMLRFLAKYSSYTNNVYDDCLMSLVQAYINSFYYKYGKAYSSELDEYMLSIRGKYATIVNERIYDLILKGYHRLFDEVYIDDEFKNILKRATNIYLFGTGEFGSMLADKLLKYGYDFNCFLNSSSNDATENIHMGKQVCGISSVDDSSENCIIMGVGTWLYADILPYVRHFKHTVVFWPFKIFSSLDEILN